MSARISIKLRRHLRRRLERTRRKTKDAQYQSRLQIVLLYNKGWGCRRVAEAVGCAPSTAIRVVKRFAELGEDGLLDGRRENGEAKVDEDLLEALRQIVPEQPEEYGWARSTWSRELLAKTLRRVAGVRVSVRTMARMLERIGARHGMARPLPRPDWPKARKARRIRKILRVVENLPENEVATSFTRAKRRSATWRSAVISSLSTFSRPTAPSAIASSAYGETCTPASLATIAAERCPT